MTTPFSDEELSRIYNWWFSGGPVPSFVVTTERWLLTVRDKERDGTSNAVSSRIRESD